MRKFSAALIIATAFSFSAQARQEHMVPKWQWVDLPPGMLSDGTGRCGIDYGGSVSEIGHNNGRVLVRYTPGPGGGLGTECNEGDVFFVPGEDFDKMTAVYETRKRLEAEERAIVKRLIDAERTR